ncbi:MAG: Gfo/Idh/MocA family oxidoreductase [Clostridiales bacterium]|nr:Gfo/Idh/MocA family oxidoreductase [Clostridiales bacterium]
MFNIGIIGCGAMAAKMIESIKVLEDVQVVAVASREKSRATKFVKKYCPDAKSLGSYYQMTRQKDIDLVYIATPNTFHYENAIMCIKSHMNVLVEKPFAMSREEADSIFTEAKNRGVFVCEAMWTSFMPLHKKMLSWINSGKIGAVRYVQSNLGYNVEDRPRITDPSLGGGAYLDLGVYPTNLAVSILGENLEPVSAFAHKYSTGVEKDLSYVLEVPHDGAMAVSFVTVASVTDRDGSVIGEDGYIKITNINDYEKIELYNDNSELVDSAVREGLNSYAVEIKACMDAVRKGLIQCPEMPWHKTAAIASLNDRIRRMF